MKKLLILLAMCTGGYAMAQDNSSTRTAGNDVSGFIKKAAMIDNKEIKAGKMAQEKALNPQVRSYGEMMVTSHTNSSAELKTIAAKKNIMLPSDNSTNAGASSSSYMGKEGQSSYSAASPVNARGYNQSTGTISARSYTGTTNMKLSKAETTPNRKYYNGAPTYWPEKRLTKASQSDAKTWSENSAASSISSTGSKGQDMKIGAGNSNMNTDWSNPALNSTANSEVSSNTNSTASTTNNTSMDEPGVSSNGNLGVSGTTGTLFTNVDFNRATLGPDSNAAMGTSTTNQNMASGTSASINVDRDMVDNGQDRLNMLGQKSGAEFDRAYIDMMVTGHSKAIQLYESASKSTDSDISSFATKMLPALKQHHEQAKTLQTTVNSTNSGL